MNPLNGLNNSKGGRPAVLALVVLLQTSAAVFFVANVLSEWREDGLGPQLWIAPGNPGHQQAGNRSFLELVNQYLLCFAGVRR